MRIAMMTVLLILNAANASAQSSSAKPGEDSKHSTGRTVSPEAKGQTQPQGSTGPINTTSGGAPASSPQGETPPGMQSAPEGSSKTIAEPKKN